MWVEGALGPARLECHKIRPWSAVWRAYVEQGTFWAKQNCPANRFEAALVEALERWQPEKFVPLTAVDTARGLMLTPDQGETLGFERRDVDLWCRLVQEWGQVQRGLVAHAEELVDLGVPALDVRSSVELAHERADALAALPADDPRRLTSEVRTRIERALPTLATSVAVVTSLDVPDTLVHNDLHGGNLFRDNGRFFDLGDAMVSQPMTDLAVPLGSLVALTSCPPDDPTLWRVTDAWIEIWSDLRPARELREAMPHAMRLARLARHEAWRRAADGLVGEELGEFRALGAEWLGAVADPPLLVGR